MKTYQELVVENARLEEWKKSAEALLKDYRDFEVTQHALEAENARLRKEYQNSDQDNMRLQQALDAERGQSNARLQKWQRSEKENARLQKRAERAEAERDKLKREQRPAWARPANCAICGHRLVCQNPECRPMAGMPDEPKV